MALLILLTRSTLKGTAQRGHVLQAPPVPVILFIFAALGSVNR